MIAEIGRAAISAWYKRSPRDRKLFARAIAVVVALGATHSVLAAMILFRVLDWLVE